MVAVADTGSTLAASQRLKVSQPTVARRIAALEESIGLTLFERLPSGYQPTPAGLALLPGARAVADAVRAFTSTAEQHRRRLSGVVRLAAPPVIAQLYVAGALTRFRGLYPDMQIEIIAQEGAPDLEAGEADVAIIVGERPAHGRLLVRRLATTGMSLFCSRRYGEAHGVPRSIEDLAGHTVLLGTGAIADAPVYSWLRDAAGQAQIGYAAGSISAHIASVRAGHGIGIMPRRLFGDDPDLIACFDAPAEFAVQTWLVAPERLRDDPAVRALLDFIGAYRGETPARYQAR